MQIFPKVFALTLGFGLVMASIAAHPGANGAAAFEKMKSLAGHWDGTTNDDGILTADIEVASNGRAVLERFQMVQGGPPMHMITVYFLDGETLKMTHYCGTGNQPTMAAVYDPEANSMTFDMISVTNMKPDDLHMHHAYFVFTDADHIREQWTLYKDQHSAGMETMYFTRKK